MDVRIGRSGNVGGWIASVAFACACLPASASALVWSAPQLVDPGHALTAVSCPTRSLCVAVDDGGNVLASGHPATAFSWGLTRVNRAGMLTAISCPSRSFCVAVGNSGMVLSSTNPSGGPHAWKRARIDRGNDLTGVSCRSQHLCVATSYQGDLVSSTDPAAGARAWKAVSPNMSDELTGISCPSVSLCVAVSALTTIEISTDPTGGPRTWHETDLSEGSASEFAAVSCASAALCIAVDTQGNVASSTHPARGKHRWRLAAADAAGAVSLDNSAQVGLTGVSCPARSLCVAGDGAGNVVVSNHPTGAARGWKQARIGGPADSSSALDFSGVSCPSKRLCVAVDANGNVEVGAAQRVPVTPRPQCDAHLPGAALMTSDVLVFAVYTPAATTYFGCVRPGGKPSSLGQDQPGNAEYGSNATTGDFGAAGTYLAAQSSSGLAAVATCTKYMPPPACPTGSFWIRVLDASSGRYLDLSTPTPVAAVTLSPGGAVAWLQPGPATGQSTLLATALRPSGQALAGAPQRLDSGAIDPGSLRFDGLTLHWTKDGQPNSQAV